jgi:large subunit ribosomal protein L4
MEAKVYNTAGKETGKVKLSKEVFDLSWNADLVAQVTKTMQDNARTPVAHTKDRSEVRGGGKKPYRQKGTGRARHGSSRSPIWTGGGVTHGPRNEKVYGGKVNKKMAAKALYTVLSEKMRNGEILFVEKLDVKEGKTKEAKNILQGLSSVKGFETLVSKKRNAAFIAFSTADEHVMRGFSNFGNVELDDVKNINVLDVLTYKTLIISDPKESVAFIESKLA